MTGEDKPDEVEGEEPNPNNPTQYDQITVGRITVNALSVTDVQKSQQQDENTSEQPQSTPKGKWWHSHNWSLPTIGIFLTAVGTLGLAAFAFMAWQEAIEGTRIARGQLVFSQRATVIIAAGVHRDRKDKTAYGINITLLNTGNTPTRNLKVEYGCLNTAGKPATDPFNMPWDERKTASLFLGPGQPDTVLACIVKTEELEDIIDSVVHKFVFVSATYEDVMSDPPLSRKTRLSRRVYFDKNRQVSTRVTGKNNCADEECP